ncbi:Ricin-type beta-trefoil lectin domain-containing protein [Streptomyces sp. yr375]|uniref:RICIN domain-containing protein n=1 Tax=Streptomyces sp. yr375 TaxID=1761906 RepID=UPI0008BB9258|nr:ricin-type beta-trefoil lectin domain protein [Streptomyces sp. yr375]SEQ68609.1 Ricin-type beta-trefoil lectin domain-containing protein [Streptomyces sp. yr375]
MIKNLTRGLTALTMTALTTLPVLGAAPSAAVPPSFQIMTALNSKCLASNGDNVEVQTCNRGTGNQLWFWEAGKLVNVAEFHCLDVRNGELNAPAQVVGDCHGLANQRWKKEGEWLRTEVNNQCLSIQNNGDPSEHAGINLRNCGPNAWQFWRLPNPS